MVVQRVLTMPRTMFVWRREDGSVTVVNALRVTDAEQAKVDALGAVKHVVRVTSLHGRDDAYYTRKYPDAVAWAPAPDLRVGGAGPRGVQYRAYSEAEPPTEALGDGVQVLMLPTKPTCVEPVLFLPAAKAIVSGDFICSFGDKAFARRPANSPTTQLSDFDVGFVSRVLLRVLGMSSQAMTMDPFLKDHINTKANKEKMFQVHARLMKLDWNTLLSSHGAPIIGNAKQVRLDWVRKAKWPATSF